MHVSRNLLLAYAREHVVRGLVRAIEREGSEP